MERHTQMDLAIETVAGAQANRSIAFLHGILGSGRNLQTLAKQFVRAHPQYSAWLVDLRGHGRSAKGTGNPTLKAVAEDIVELAAKNLPPLHALAGHSFGGKVALEVARLNCIPALRNIVVIDSMPGVREPMRGGDSALDIIDLLKALPQSFSSIAEFVGTLQNAGLTRPVAQWLAGSLERQGDRVRFGLDLNEISALILDYLAEDLWPVVENPPDHLRIHLVVGDRSGSYSTSDLDRAKRIAATNKQITVRVLPAGHWVHVDDPQGLLGVMSLIDIDEGWSPKRQFR